ncbi:MAG TPA: hypothetical protein DGG94_01485 [Micromonosporaceae bacterium]|nr:hypothetical protein [Micromonosporaceae bacterium]HCU48500.1 hypothetical protein [Micromonosporaceae bacterium]
MSFLAGAAGVAGIITGIVLMRLGFLQQDEGADDPNPFARPWWYKVALGAAIGLAGATILGNAVTQP